MQMRLLSIIICAILLIACNKRKPQQKVDTNILREQLIEKNINFLKEEKQFIKSYVDSSSWDMAITKTGLYYQIIEEGSGELAKQGSIVSLKGHMRLLNGDTIYTEKELGNRKFEIGHSLKESGLQEGITYMNQGSKGRLIIPSYLGHGLTGDLNKVPVRSPIIYEFTLLSVE